MDGLAEFVKSAVAAVLQEQGMTLEVRPEWFPQPRKHRGDGPVEVDPWFGMSYHDWTAARSEGFTGFRTTARGGKGGGKTWIHFASARKWIGEPVPGRARDEEGRATDGTNDTDFTNLDRR